MNVHGKITTYCKLRGKMRFLLRMKSTFCLSGGGLRGSHLFIWVDQLTSCLAKLCLRTFVLKLYCVHCVHTLVSTEEMFSAAKYFKYIQSGSGPRVVTQKI